MLTVEFIYESTCPFTKATRKRLIKAFGVAGLTPSWMEWEVGDPVAPAYVRRYGSPTILVNGKDVVDDALEQASSSCRIYSLEGEECGVPPLGKIVAALAAEVNTQQGNGTRAFGLNAAMLPSIAATLLPKLTCPACWPAYAGLLSSLGVGFFDYTPYLFPLTGFFLAIALLAMAYRASTRHGYGPLGIGVIGAAVVMIGKFTFDSEAAMWIGIAILVAASLWNTWPKRSDAKLEQRAACRSCADVKA